MVSYKAFVLSFFNYNTQRMLIIKNKKVGILFRLLQLCVLSYILGYVIIYQKGYQEFTIIQSTTSTKLKGVEYTNYSNDLFNPIILNPEDYRRIWDITDFVVPPSEQNAFFLTTNIEITSKQKRGKCPENPYIRGAKCQANKDCKKGFPLLKGNGVLTGRCIKSDIDKQEKVCEIYAWCPVERDVNPLKDGTALFPETKKFSVLIKNFVYFPKYRIQRTNIPDFSDPDELKQCTYHPVDDPLCPIFILEDIVPGNYDELAVKGAAIAIIIRWECNFDFNPSNCFPTYSFRRLDKYMPVANGVNFRYSNYYSDTERTRYKAYGIQFIILTVGRGGKFSVLPLFLNIGSGLGFFIGVKILCDFIVMFCLTKRKHYILAKYLEVDNQIRSDDLLGSNKIVNSYQTVEET